MEVQTNVAVCLESFANETVFNEPLSDEESEEVMLVACSILAGAVCANKKSLKSRVRLLQSAYQAMEKLIIRIEQEKREEEEKKE